MSRSIGIGAQTDKTLDRPPTVVHDFGVGD